MILSNKVYDFLKVVTLLILPAAATLYFTIAQIWGLPNAEEVIGTITAVATFLGVITRISTSSFQKNGADGVVVVEPNGDRKVFSLELNTDPDELQNQQVITLKVDNKVNPA